MRSSFENHAWSKFPLVVVDPAESLLAWALRLDAASEGAPDLDVSTRMGKESAGGPSMLTEACSLSPTSLLLPKSLQVGAPQMDCGSRMLELLQAHS